MRHIYEHNIPELKQYAGAVGSNVANSCLTPIMATDHPELGRFCLSDLGFPGMRILDMQWGIPDDMTIHETYPSETIDVNFVLDGNIEGSYRGLDRTFGMTTNTNNLKYTPFEKSTHRGGKQVANMFAIAFEKKYFCDLIGHDNKWSEGIQRKLERDENFIASDQFLKTTPAMQALIHSIRETQAGPMSRLMAQSMIFELLAHQVQQLSNLQQPATAVAGISQDDIQKLHVLKAHIDQHFLMELNLTDLCRASMLNEFKLKKGFKALFGTSVMQYARQLRMEHARLLLRDYRLSIEEVASTLGYDYPNHFSTAYKKFFGTLPSHR